MDPMCLRIVCIMQPYTSNRSRATDNTVRCSDRCRTCERLTRETRRFDVVSSRDSRRRNVDVIGTVHGYVAWISWSDDESALPPR